MRWHEARGIHVFNPHTHVLEDGGMKQTDWAQLGFKTGADPVGPGTPPSKVSNEQTKSRKKSRVIFGHQLKTRIAFIYSSIYKTFCRLSDHQTHSYDDETFHSEQLPYLYIVLVSFHFFFCRFAFFKFNLRLPMTWVACSTRGRCARGRSREPRLKVPIRKGPFRRRIGWRNGGREGRWRLGSTRSVRRWWGRHRRPGRRSRRRRGLKEKVVSGPSGRLKTSLPPT